MRARMYDFLWIVFSVPLILLWMASGGAGFLFAAFIMAVTFLRSFVLVLQITTYSDKVVTDSLSNSTDGKYFDRCDAIGEVVIQKEAHEMPDGKASAIKTAAFPAVRFYELGTGEWGLAKKWGGNEHGFLIINELLCLQFSDAGSIVGLGPTVSLRPVHHGALQLLRQVKPTEQDMRKVLHPEWWSRLRAHPRFNVRKSVVHLILDPYFPIITADKLGNPILMMPGADAVPGKHGPIPPLVFMLTDVVGKNSPVLDLRPQMRMERDAAMEALRTEMGDKVNTVMEINQGLREELAAAYGIEEQVSPQEMMKAKIVETLAGSEQTGERLR